MPVACVLHTFVPVFPLSRENPTYSRVKAIGAIAPHQLWTIGAVAPPTHFQHSGVVVLDGEGRDSRHLAHLQRGRRDSIARLNAG